MLVVELGALRNALFRQEAVVIFPPGSDLLGGTVHGLDDFRLRLAFAQQRQHLLLRQLIARHHLVHEGDDLGALQIEGGVFGCGFVPCARRNCQQQRQNQQSDA